MREATFEHADNETSLIQQPSVPMEQFASIAEEAREHTALQRYQVFLIVKGTLHPSQKVPEKSSCFGRK